MRVVRFSFTENSGDLEETFRIRERRVIARPGFRIQFTDEQGICGIGEASPLPDYSLDSFGDCRQFLRGWKTSFELPESEDDWSDGETIRAFLRASEVPSTLPSIIFSLETALLDLLSRRRNRPAHLCLNSAAAIPTVSVNALLDIRLSTTEISEQLETMRAAGTGAVKVKVGGADLNAADELSKLQHIRATLGLDTEIRLDANGLFSIEEVLRRAKGYMDVGVAFIEEPCAVEGWEKLRALGLGVGADESLVNPVARELIFSRNMADVVVLKPATLGGLLSAHDIARRAFSSGMSVVVTHLFDGPVALCACRTLAFSLPQMPLACGLAPHPGLCSWPDVPADMLKLEGVLHCPDTPGIGFSAEGIGSNRG